MIETSHTTIHYKHYSCSRRIITKKPFSNSATSTPPATVSTNAFFLIYHTHVLGGAVSPRRATIIL